MRKVNVFQWGTDKETGKPKKYPNGTAIFHAIGCDFAEFESGPGNFSTAIIEREDGRFENPPIDMIQFINPTPENEAK